MVWLAGHPEGPLTTRQIADATQVPAGYLAKVLQPLGRASLVHSRRGLNGGFTLAKAPEHISVLEVINAVEPPAPGSSAPGNSAPGAPGHSQSNHHAAHSGGVGADAADAEGAAHAAAELASLDERLRSVVRSIRKSLDRCSIADLIANGAIENSSAGPSESDIVDPRS